MKFFCFALLLTLTLSCSNVETKRSQLIHYLPSGASVIIKTNNLENLQSSFNNNDFIKRLTEATGESSLLKKLQFATLLKPSGDILIGLGHNMKDSVEISLATKNHKNLFIRDSLSDYLEETIIFSDKTIIKSTIDKQVFYSTLVDSIFIASTSIQTIEAMYQKPQIDSNLEQIENSLSHHASASLILEKNNPFIQSFLIEDSIALNSFCDYTAIDLEINQNTVSFSGIAKASDSTSLLNIFKNTIPKENQIQHVTPSNSDGFLSLSFDNFETFYQNLNVINKQDSITPSTELFNDLHEIGIIYEGDNHAIILNSIDVIATNDALIAEQNNIETYRQIDIFSFSDPTIFNTVLRPFVNASNFDKYCVLDSFFVFASNTELIQNIIANYQNKTTLSERSYFQDMYNKLSDASSLLCVVNSASLENMLNINVSKDISIDLEAYKTSAIQFVYDKDFAHVNGFIGKTKTRAADETISEEFSLKLEYDLLTNPQFVTNHITKQKEIVVQDVRNNLYLISNEGKILWKKQLQGPVLGNIEQIDIYKNGRLQLVFATPNRLYVIDRNGQDVAPFPATFNDEITQPLSVFDYDKRKDYRLMVTQGKNVLMYNTKAKLVNGFVFKQAEETIIHQPQHFRVGSKDYLTIKTKDKLYILDRTGRNRITPKTSYSYSSEGIYFYDNKFTTTASNGDLISIDTKGHVSSQNLNLGDKHHIDASTKTLVTLSENKLAIRNNSLELDYGNYTPPKFYYLYDKIYVATTDLQTQKVYIFDSQAKLIANFPVYANSSIELDNVDKDYNLEFVTKGDSNALILYQIN